MVIDEFLHPFNKLTFPVLHCDLNVSPPGERFGHHMELLHTVALVVIVFSRDRSRSRRERIVHVSPKRLACFIETDDRVIWLVGFVIE
jgi:hypothetical protein